MLSACKKIWNFVLHLPMALTRRSCNHCFPKRCHRQKLCQSTPFGCPFKGLFFQLLYLESIKYDYDIYPLVKICLNFRSLISHHINHAHASYSICRVKNYILGRHTLLCAGYAFGFTPNICAAILCLLFCFHSQLGDFLDRT